MPTPKRAKVVSRRGPERQERLIMALRTYGASYTELTKAFAASLGLHPTDANALVEVIYAEDNGTPLSPAALSAKLGLSRPATSAVLNRLEANGHVIRSHEHTDRRVVTLRVGPGMQAPVLAFFTPLSLAVARMLDRYPARMVDEFEEFIREFSATVTSSLEARQGAP